MEILEYFRAAEAILDDSPLDELEQRENYGDRDFPEEIEDPKQLRALPYLNIRRTWGTGDSIFDRLGELDIKLEEDRKACTREPQEDGTEIVTRTYRVVLQIRNLGGNQMTPEQLTDHVHFATRLNVLMARLRRLEIEPITLTLRDRTSLKPKLTEVEKAYMRFVPTSTSNLADIYTVAYIEAAAEKVGVKLRGSRKAEKIDSFKTALAARVDLDLIEEHRNFQEVDFP